MLKFTVTVDDSANNGSQKLTIEPVSLAGEEPIEGLQQICDDAACAVDCTIAWMANVLGCAQAEGFDDETDAPDGTSH